MAKKGDSSGKKKSSKKEDDVEEDEIMEEKGKKKATKKKAKDEDGDVDMEDDDDSDEEEMEFVEHNKRDSNLPVEKVYQKKTQLEHILLRPDTYIGSTEKSAQEQWIYDTEKKEMKFKKISFVPGLYKIFDEILVNAIDNSVNCEDQTGIKVEIKPSEKMLSIWNDGGGIPVEMHKEHNVYVPTLIFGHLLTGSNFNDSEKKITGGRNGYGAKLANIFSTKFIVEVYDAKNQKLFTQTWENNMSTTGEPKVTSKKQKTSYTKISFYPDLEKFHMKELEPDIVSLLTKRVYDVAGVTRSSISVYLNEEKIPVKTFKDYVGMFLTPDQKKLLAYHETNRWKVGVCPNDSGSLQQVSFVNGISTMNGGKHVEYIVGQITKYLLKILKKKQKTLEFKPAFVKAHLFVFVDCQIINPAFSSQTKELLTTVAKNFGSKVEIGEKSKDDKVKKFLKTLASQGAGSILDAIISFTKLKEASGLKKKGGSKRKKVNDIEKLDDANKAGGKDSQNCTLILTEGDSAKTLAVSGLSVVGRDEFGVFPLRGKVLNVRDCPSLKVSKNEEITNITKIMGLEYDKKYENAEDLKSLRYGSIMIMSDQDTDGSHIKGLLINYIHKFWPNLLKHEGFMKEFITPIVKVTNKKTKEVISFYSEPEYAKWKEDQGGDTKSWGIKYYKGLGTSTAQEAKEYFRNIKQNMLKFQKDDTTDEKVEMAFAKNRAEDRKKWMAGYVEGTHLDQKSKFVKYTDFFDKELILYSIADCERSIPNIVDGLKPSTRKILFCCFKRNLKREIKVAQLTGYVSEHAAYHHGEQSLSEAIVKMAQGFVGSNNINLLHPGGQFGTRLQGGDDHASGRYIFTKLAKITRSIYKEDDDHILDYLDDDGLSVEPKFYVPVIPMVLVNGASGIGMGWSTDIPNYNPLDLIDNLRRKLKGEELVEMSPWYKGFCGQIIEGTASKSSGFTTHGIIQELDVDDIHGVYISELPVGVWTQNYKEMIVAALSTGKDDKKEKKDKKDKKEKRGPRSGFQFEIDDFNENHTDTKVSFTIYLNEENMKKAKSIGLAKAFKLTSNLHISNMVLFNEKEQIRNYKSSSDIMNEFFDVRMRFYQLRKQFITDKLTREYDVADNKARFITMICDGDLIVSRKARTVLIDELDKLKFKRFSKKDLTISKSPHATPKKDDGEEEEEEEEEDEEEEEEEKPTKGKKGAVKKEAVKKEAKGKGKASKKGGEKDEGFNYLINMQISSLTREKAEKLMNEKEKKKVELDEVKKKTVDQFYLEDLDGLEKEIKEFFAEENKELGVSKPPSIGNKKGMKSMKGKKLKLKSPAELPKIKVPVKREPKKEKDVKEEDKKEGTEAKEGTEVKEETEIKEEKEEKPKKKAVAPKKKKEDDEDDEEAEEEEEKKPKKATNKKPSASKRSKTPIDDLEEEEEEEFVEFDDSEEEEEEDFKAEEDDDENPEEEEEPSNISLDDVASASSSANTSPVKKPESSTSSPAKKPESSTSSSQEKEKKKEEVQKPKPKLNLMETIDLDEQEKKELPTQQTETPKPEETTTTTTAIRRKRTRVEAEETEKPKEKEEDDDGEVEVVAKSPEAKKRKIEEAKKPVKRGNKKTVESDDEEEFDFFEDEEEDEPDDEDDESFHDE